MHPYTTIYFVLPSEHTVRRNIFEGILLRDRRGFGERVDAIAKHLGASGWFRA